jgi:transposase
VFNREMKPLYARPLTPEEETTLHRHLKSNDGQTVRRAQMLLMSAGEHLKVDEIAHRLGCHGQTVRQLLHAFEKDGLACLEARSRARLDDQRAFDEAGRDGLKGLLHRSPREFGHDMSLWTLKALAQVSFEHGLTRQPISRETVRATLASMKIDWRRAKHWITSPDAHYETKKSDAIG